MTSTEVHPFFFFFFFYYLGAVWFVFLNNIFQFLNNISHISIFFFHLYVFLQIFSNNNFQFLNTYTKRALKYSCMVM